MELVLYRGDFEKIHEFKYKKTHAWSLVGKGIYLTNDLKIAQSYRTKGGSEEATKTLFIGEAANRTEALKAAFKTFCEFQWRNKGGRGRYLSGTEAIRFEQSCQAQWSQLIEAGAIKADYISHPIPTGGRRCGASSAQRAHQKERLKHAPPRLKVEWDKDIKVGYVSKFIFDKAYIDTNVLHVDRPCYDEAFWGLMYDRQIAIGRQYATREDYVKANRGRRILQTTGEFTAWEKVKNALMPYGIIGYEYNGGQRLGGGYNHRAFCLWNDEFVNQHKIERFR